jgi:proteasome lid subunit RPN8/RPN11
VNEPDVDLVVEHAVRDALVEHAREGLTAPDGPVEVCGVLAGRRPKSDDGVPGGGTTGSDVEPRSDVEPGAITLDSGDTPGGSPGCPTRVTESRRVPNVATPARTRYELDPAATVAAIDAIEAAGLDHVGFYHSHPDGPLAPSDVDRAAAQWPDRVYAIVDPRAAGDDDPAAGLGAWRWTGESFEPLSIRVVED